ncbi:hypothetical protein DFH07DRAFT_309549 [Mycena maculata]|uniref:Yeast cell wall synthesis Kre9/Knh1-like N-terminal domain-containing protein n=1 Tax=Mycena maculata TaxID=230809 RepID=A0AAD7HGH6_9AGAR|nr:hypothetical protein DFH07DRAFT_309549 [Mycena maculata]
MFSALKLWVVMLVVSVAFAVDIQVPETPASGGMTTITWTTDPSFTQPFSIELVHPDFNNAFAIANNVKASLGTLNVSLPTVAPGDGYTLEFVNITNINQKYGTSPSFSIAAAPSTTASSTATSPGTSGTAPSVSAASAE